MKLTQEQEDRWAKELRAVWVKNDAQWKGVARRAAELAGELQPAGYTVGQIRESVADVLKNNEFWYVSSTGFPRILDAIITRLNAPPKPPERVTVQEAGKFPLYKVDGQVVNSDFIKAALVAYLERKG